VAVSVIGPASVGPGVYFVLGSDGSSKLPFPEVDHTNPVAEPPKVAFNTANPSEQIVCGVPASTTGSSAMVITTLSLTTEHGPVVLMVSVTVPLSLSSGPGVYSAPGRNLSLNEPSPDVDHSMPAAPLKDPCSVTVVPDSQSSSAGPASTVPPAVTVITTSS